MLDERPRTLVLITGNDRKERKGRANTAVIEMRDEHRTQVMQTLKRHLHYHIEILGPLHPDAVARFGSMLREMPDFPTMRKRTAAIRKLIKQFVALQEK